MPLDNKNKIFKSGGFTLVELLVVISIMSMLFSISTASYTTAINKSKIIRAKTDLAIINFAMEKYMQDNDDYPPYGDDHNSATGLDPNAPPEWILGTWDEIADVLDNSNYGPNIPRIDPWGNSYGFDKNYKQYYNPAWSIICSAGPNKVLETSTGQTEGEITGDDVCIFFPDND